VAARLSPRRKLALIGFMGAGKTTAARAIGEGALDVDQVIEAREGLSVREIFAARGEAAFRELEERTTLELLEDPAVQVLALGGGAVLSERVRAALRERCRTLWLQAAVDDELWARVEHQQRDGEAPRPLAQNPARFFALHAEREPLYEALADIVVPASRSREIRRVLAALDGVPEDTRVLWAAARSGDYPVLIGEGLLTGRRFWPAGLDGRRLLVTDHNAGRHYGGSLAPYLGEIRIVPGEQSKTIAHAEIVWSEMVRHGASRSDIVVALGGGVVGDLAGFCAATYQRGIRLVQVPTTLLAQVDSALGGKTGVDLPEAKNYVGAFHQPSAVIADPTTLRTLPPEEVAAGYAEVVKTALIAGGELWERVRSGAAPTEPDVIARCAHRKLLIVTQDEHDRGLRQLLNLGHTVAHAIETATGYARYRHGEAVGLGLLAELRLSGAAELREEVALLLRAQGLPTRLQDVELEEVIFATGRDKKRIGEGAVPFVLCPAPGRCQIGQTVAPAELRAAVRELMA
jgi:shikimate kinase/3-dehydroquinate synthase